MSRAEPKCQPAGNHAAQADRQRKHVEATRSTRFACCLPAGYRGRRRRLSRTIRGSVSARCAVTIAAKDACQAIKPVVLAPDEPSVADEATGSALPCVAAASERRDHREI